MVTAGLKQRLFFMYFIAAQWHKDLWCISLWPLDICRMPIVSSTNWINTVMNVDSVLGFRSSSLPFLILHAALLCNTLWFSRNKAIHEGHLVDLNELSSLDSRYAEHSLA